MDMMEDFKSIIITQNSKKVSIKENPNNYEVIGNGAQGVVLKLSPDRCVKLYTNSTYTNLEEKVLRATSESRFFPKTYESGKNYIVMEYLKGPSLEGFLKNEELSEHIANEILLILKEMEKLGFSRIDCILRHIFIDAEGNLKVIDHVNAFVKTRPFPKKLFGELNRLGALDKFINYIKNIDEEMYLKWKKSKTLSKYFK
jgi:predicted Ser/Thr protein kinase